MLKEQVANHTLAWTDEDKFTFIWDYDLVLVYVNPEFGHKKVITDHGFDVLREIYVWLDSDPKLPTNPFDYVWLDSDPKLPTNPLEFEGKHGTETNWD